MVWKVQFLQFFSRILQFGQKVSHSSKQHGGSTHSCMQQTGQQAATKLRFCNEKRPH